jgi:hypothetical protein
MLPQKQVKRKRKAESFENFPFDIAFCQQGVYNRKVNCCLHD